MNRLKNILFDVIICCMRSAFLLTEAHGRATAEGSSLLRRIQKLNLFSLATIIYRSESNLHFNSWHSLKITVIWRWETHLRTECVISRFLLFWAEQKKLNLICDELSVSQNWTKKEWTQRQNEQKFLSNTVVSIIWLEIFLKIMSLLQ